MIILTDRTVRTDREQTILRFHFAFNIQYAKSACDVREMIILTDRTVRTDREQTILRRSVCFAMATGSRGAKFEQNV